MTTELVMTETTTSYGDRFYVYRTTGDHYRFSAVALAGLQPEAVLRLGMKTIVPAGNITRAEFDAWLADFRRQGVAADLLPPNELA
jgi:hypothetical protein